MQYAAITIRQVRTDAEAQDALFEWWTAMDGALEELEEALAQPEPEPVACAWMHNGSMVNAFPRPPGDSALWDSDGYWASKGYSRAPLYAAPPDFAARLRQLETELELAHDARRRAVLEADEAKEARNRIRLQTERKLTGEGWRPCATGQGSTQYCALLQDAVAAETERCRLIVASIAANAPSTVEGWVKAWEATNDRMRPAGAPLLNPLNLPVEEWEVERAQAFVPRGWRLVPEQPTSAMIDAGQVHTARVGADHEDANDEHWRARGQAIAVYRDMLAVAPAASAGGLDAA